MVVNSYFPRRGDIVWIDMNPRIGHEQSGRRPPVIISPESYNRRVGLAVFCPITNQIKNYPFEVILPKGQIITGAVLCDQLKNLDWKARKSEFIESLDVQTVDRIRVLARSLL